MNPRDAMLALAGSLEATRKTLLPADDCDFVSTVMGPAIKPEEIDAAVETLRDDDSMKTIIDTMKKKKTTDGNISEMMSVVSSQWYDHAMKFRSGLQARLTAAVSQMEKTIRDAAKKAGEGAAEVQHTLSRAMTKAHQKRLKSQKRWRDDIKFCSDIITDSQANDRDRLAVDDRMRTLRQAEDYSILNESNEMTRLKDKVKLIDASQKSTQKRIIEHYFHGKCATDTAVAGKQGKLQVPADLTQHHKGEDLCNAALTWQEDSLGQYYLSYAIIRRMLDDYDPDTGMHWLPREWVDPATPEAQRELPATLLKVLEPQSKGLYEELMLRLPETVKDRIASAYSYGTDPVHEGRVEEDHGIMAVHAILSLYTQHDQIYQNDVRDKILALFAKYYQGDPTVHNVQARKLFTEAEEQRIPIPWDLFGAKVATILSQRDNVFSQNLQKYGPEGKAYKSHKNKHDSAVLVDQMFATIDKSCKQIESAHRGKTSHQIFEIYLS